MSASEARPSTGDARPRWLVRLADWTDRRRGPLDPRAARVAAYWQGLPPQQRGKMSLLLFLNSLVGLGVYTGWLVQVVLVVRRLRRGRPLLTPGVAVLIGTTAAWEATRRAALRRADAAARRASATDT